MSSFSFNFCLCFTTPPLNFAPFVVIGSAQLAVRSGNTGNRIGGILIIAGAYQSSNLLDLIISSETKSDLLGQVKLELAQSSHFP